MNRIDFWRLRTALHARDLAVIASPLGGWFVQRSKTHG